MPPTISSTPVELHARFLFRQTGLPCSVRGARERSQGRGFDAVMESIGTPAEAVVESSSRSPDRERGPAVFVWGVWLAMVYGAIDFVNRFGVDVPYLDEWEMVPVLTGNERISLRWLWSQHNEHRIPLPRLLYLLIEKLSHCDFRAGPFFNVFVLSGMAAACIVVASRVRSKPSFPDAFFPLVLLHWGQWENLISGFQIVFISSVALSFVMLFVITFSCTERLPLRSAVTYGVCLMALPLCGGSGLGLVPALTSWSLYVAIVEWRVGDREGRRTARVLGGLILAAVALTGVYFIGYHRPEVHPGPPPSSWIPLTSALKVLTVGFGPAVRPYWPLSGQLMCVLLGATATVGLRLVWQGRERTRALGFLLFIGGLVCVAAGIGWSRAGLPYDASYQSRYATLCAPLLCAIYLLWEVSDRTDAARFVQACLFVVSSTLLFRNADGGVAGAKPSTDARQLVLSRALAGKPLKTIAHSYKHVYPDPGVLGSGLRMLHDAGIGAFKLINVR